ncbi:transketolase [Maricaulis maris MCS10]|uniref:Transketolase n=1 Tax=Maricaulis maris (strain MCS10) TaxID=394221 RepID=Q0ALX1_MARMM|nr:transketolase [Maricaulis maris]ABI66722.1 transketolase [Maricaulis maris MCS10]
MTTPSNPVSMSDMANAIRALSMDAVQQANSGHPGMPMGMADVAAVLWSKHMKFDPAAPAWADRDRFVLSAGHGSMLLYSILHLAGFEDISMDELKKFRQLDSLTAGHPEYGHTPGVEATTGPLGQGISMSVGMALAERMMNARYGDDLVDHRTWVIASDGDLQEGISHEAISLAGHLGLNRFCVLWDDNEISIDGPTDLSESTDVLKRFEAAGWSVSRIDGHDHAAIDAALQKARSSDKPVLIACRTTIGYGAPTKAGTAGSHGAPLGADEIAGAREALGWTAAPFEIPEEILDAWRATGSADAHQAWQERLAGADRADDFVAQISGEPGETEIAALDAWRQKVAAEKPVLASRAASGQTLAAIIGDWPSLAGGSADLAGSNLTKTPDVGIVKAGDYAGQYIHFGVREHGMAACANGMSLHGGFRPHVATFLVFADYCRPSMRLSSLMHQPVVYVMTHDSIGLGEDGPTHQPVETLASLRAIPNMHVFRPADALETAEAWDLALRRIDGPSVLALSRQKLPFLRSDDGSTNLSASGAYTLSDDVGSPDIVLVATGSEVCLAVEAARTLRAQGRKVRVVSAPCLDLLLEQGDAYLDELFPAGIPVVACEAALRFGWDQVIGRKGGFVGMTGFGASAPAEDLYAHFGITSAAIVEQAEALLA